MMIAKDANSNLVYSKLIEEMRSGRFAALHKLPPEEELAEALQISRTQLRDILGQMESAGYISRRRGVGTIINRHVFALGVRADIETEFRRIITEMGMVPGIASTKITKIFSDEVLSDRLSIRNNSPVYRIDRLVTANGKKVIYCEDYLPFQLIKHFDYADEDLEQPIFDFLSRFCEEKVYMDITRMKPVIADERLADLLEISLGTPLLLLDEVAYSFEGVALFRSIEYYTEEVSEQTLLRRGHP